MSFFQCTSKNSKRSSSSSSYRTQHKRNIVSNMSKLSATFRPTAPDDRTFKSVCKANEHYSRKEYKLAIGKNVVFSYFLEGIHYV